jgi:hypothetical protein
MAMIQQQQPQVIPENSPSHVVPVVVAYTGYNSMNIKYQFGAGMSCFLILILYFAGSEVSKNNPLNYINSFFIVSFIMNRCR